MGRRSRRRDGVRLVGTVAAIVFAGRWMVMPSVSVPGGGDRGGGGAGTGAVFAPALDAASAATSQSGFDLSSGRVLLGVDGDTSAAIQECSGRKMYDEVHELSGKLFIVGDVLAGFIDFSRNSCPSASDAQEALQSAVGLLVISVLIVLLVLAIVADAFFCPSVTNIVDEFRIPSALAGVTLLPLGNGAPDVFAAIVAASKGSGEIGAGAIGGASLFVTSVVLGTVFIVAEPFRITPRAFLRDCSFFLLAIFFFLINARSRLIDPALGVFGLPCLYITYICVVVYGQYSSRLEKNRCDRLHHVSQQWNENHTDTGMDEPLLDKYDDDDGVSNQDSESDETAPYSVIDYYFRAVRVKATFGQLAAVSHVAAGTDIEAARHRVLEAPAIMVRVHNENSAEEEKERASIRLQSRRRSISFDAGDAAFTREIEALQTSVKGGGVEPENSWSPKSATSDRASDRAYRPLHSLPSPSSRPFDAAAAKSAGDASRSNTIPMTTRDVVSENEKETSLLGGDVRLHLDKREKVTNEPGIEMGARDMGREEEGDEDRAAICVDDTIRSGLRTLELVWSMIEFPIYWAIAFCVPQPDEDKFACWVVAINAFTLPFTGTFFFSSILGLEHGPSSVVLLYIGSASFVALAVPVFVLLRMYVKDSNSDGDTTNTADAFDVTNTSRMHRIRLTMTVLSFLTCVMLLSLSADVLVDYLVAIGKLLGIDSFTVGATILAWGNSAGDFLTDVTIARLPHAAPAAVAGAICGPFFNLSIGLGIALCILAGQSASSASTFVIPGSDTLGMCLFLFLATCLVLTMLCVALSRFYSSRNVGHVLYIYYALALGGLLALKRFVL